MPCGRRRACRRRRCVSAVAVGDIDGTVGPGQRRCDAPGVGGLKAGFGRSGDLLDDGTVGLHLDEQAILLRCALLDGRVEIHFPALFGVDHGMDLGILVRDALEEFSVGGVDKDSGLALGADIDVPGAVDGDGTVRSSEGHTVGQGSPAVDEAVGPCAVSSEVIDRGRLLGPLNGEGGNCRCGGQSAEGAA